MSPSETRRPEAAPPGFAEQTRISADPERPGLYRALLRPGWNAPIHPSGGVVTALALRAMEAALGRSDHRLRTLTTMFVAPVTDGPVEIEVECLREGRRMSQLRATVRNPGDGPGHVTIAAFGESREAFAFVPEAPPRVDGPDAYPGPAEPPPGAPVFRPAFFERVETRRVRMFHSFESGWEGGLSEATRWMRYRETPRLPDGRLDPFALPALADTMPPAIGQFLGPGHPMFHCPSVDLTLHVLAETKSEWLLTRARARWAGDGYASAEIHLWDRELRLVAHGSQLMLIRFPEPQEFAGG